MQKAIFLDRDGIINKEINHYITSPDAFELNDGVAEFLTLMQLRGYLLIVITNQGGIAKGLYSVETLHRIHDKMRNILPGIRFSAVYYCPHHPDFGQCLCRKPDSVLVEKALARFDIDPLQSYFIGDKERDVACGNKAGVKHNILVPPNTNLMSLVEQIA